MFTKKTQSEDIESILNTNQNILSQNCLSTLINGYPYLPYTESAIDFHSMQIIINDIVINNRKSIIEYGSGISTILIGRLFKSNNLNAKLYSIDDNEGWYHAMKEKINHESLENYIELVYAPLEKISLIENVNHSLKWYSTEVLNKALGNTLFDMIITDGPMAYMKEIERSRFPALPYMKNKMNKDYSVFLHDTNRYGEKTIIEDWEKILNIKSRRFTNKLTGFIVGKEYTISV